MARRTGIEPVIMIRQTIVITASLTPDVFATFLSSPKRNYRVFFTTLLRINSPFCPAFIRLIVFTILKAFFIFTFINFRPFYFTLRIKLKRTPNSSFHNYLLLVTSLTTFFATRINTKSINYNGAGDRNRTCNLRITRPLRYQLRHASIKIASDKVWRNHRIRNSLMSYRDARNDNN